MILAKDNIVFYSCSTWVCNVQVNWAAYYSLQAFQYSMLAGCNFQVWNTKALKFVLRQTTAHCLIYLHIACLNWTLTNVHDIIFEQYRTWSLIVLGCISLPLLDCINIVITLDVDIKLSVNRSSSEVKCCSSSNASIVTLKGWSGKYSSLLYLCI